MASTVTSEVSEGPVLSLISKRLRALRKKYNRIVQMEESVAQGKPINSEQEEVLRSKPAVSSLIDELEKLRQPLSVAVQEELNLALKTHQAPSTPPADENVKPGEADQSKTESGDALVEDLLNLLYFGSMFDVKSQRDFSSKFLIRTHERECCLSYDYVTDEATDLLREEDLDLISHLSGLLISRPADSSFSHRNALQRCIEHAKAWLAKSDESIDSNASVTYVKLRERLQRIMASDYFTATPEIKPPALEMAAAAAAGNYAPFQVSGQGVSVPVPVQGEGSVVQYPPKDDETATNQEHETGGSQSSSIQEHQKDEPDAQNPSEDVSVQQEQVNQEVEMEHNQREFDTREQQNIPRRGYQNQRERGGRGRRGYSNGRGGRSAGRGAGNGPYQNGRNQQYDQPGNYYPRGYQNNRGGGARAGYNHRGPSVQGGHNPSDVGVGA